MLRGIAFKLMGRHKEALADFNRAIGSDEKDPLEITLRGTTYILLGRYQEALVDFDRAIVLDEKNILAIAERGILHILQGRYQEALADFDRVIALDEKNAFTIINQNLIDIQAKRPQEPLKELSRIIKKLDETNDGSVQQKSSVVIFAEFMKRMGEIYQSKGNNEEALAMLNHAIDLDEQNVIAFFSRSQIYDLMGHYQEALADLDHAIALDEQNAMALCSRGELYSRMGHYQEALADLDHAIALDEQNAMALCSRGGIYSRMGRYQEALADMDHAIALDKDEGFIFKRGAILSYLKQYAKAIECFKQVLNKTPKDSHALYNMATIMVRSKRLSEAQLYIHKTRIEINKRKTATDKLYMLGGLAALTSDIDQALEYLEQAIQLQGKIAEKSEARVVDMARDDIAWLDLRDDPRFQAIIAE